MKKLIYLIVALVILGLIASGCFPVVPTLDEKGNNGNGNGNGNGIDLTGYHYNLNLIGKKANWSGGGNYEGNRHTMFVPESTEGLSFTVGSYTILDSIKISMTQGTEFEVVDGNWFDDEECAFQLGAGKYEVYIVAKAKPGGSTYIKGWVYCEENGGEFLFGIGDVTVTKSKKWKDITELFYVSEGEEPDTIGLLSNKDNVWVFDYLTALGDAGYTNAEYFWQYQNFGNKLVKVRFYPI